MALSVSKFWISALREFCFSVELGLRRRLIIAQRASASLLERLALYSYIYPYGLNITIIYLSKHFHIGARTKTIYIIHLLHKYILFNMLMAQVRASLNGLSFELFTPTLVCNGLFSCLCHLLAGSLPQHYGFVSYNGLFS